MGTKIDQIKINGPYFMPSVTYLNSNSDKANAVLAPYLSMNENALELYNQKLTALFPTDAAKVNQLLMLRKKEFNWVGVYYAVPELNLYFKLNELSDCLDRLFVLYQQINKMKEMGVSIESPFYKSVYAVFENALNATTTLISRKKINTDMMLALSLLKKTVVTTTDICLQPNNQELRDSLLPAIVELSQESDKILCPYARKAVGESILLFAITSLLVLPSAILISPIILLVYGMYLTHAFIAWSGASEQGMSFWNKETSSQLKPVVNSLTTFFKTKPDEQPISLSAVTGSEESASLEHTERTKLQA